MAFGKSPGLPLDGEARRRSRGHLVHHLAGLRGVHGLLFIAYLWVIIRAKFTLGWSQRRTVAATISSVVPFAPYFVAHNQSAD
jgi:integral membrane protein